MMRSTALKHYSLALAITLLSCILPPQASAQELSLKDREVLGIIERAQFAYRDGDEAYNKGDYETARQKFDQAIDIILEAGIDINADTRLKEYYRQLIEKIHAYQLAAIALKQDGFSLQTYEPSPLDFLAKVTDEELNEAGADAAVEGQFNFNFTPDTPVYQFINYFTQGKGRTTMEAGLRRSGRYREMAERIFKEEGVPTDLIWLAQVESLWSPIALSHAEAKGIWQFVSSTGSRYGLAQNAWVDERSDPEKSTRAAARYLKFLHRYFDNDWMLAIAAYNCGEGAVERAIKRAGYADYWELHRRGLLPQETRNYVPAVLAAVTIAKNQEKYGFKVQPDAPWGYDSHTIQSQTNLRTLAQILKTSYADLLTLNPELQRGVTPPGNYVIRLPKGKKDALLTYTAVPATRKSKRKPVLQKLEGNNQ